MKIALVQLEVKSGDVDTNRRRGLELARQAAQQADIVVLPEIWTTGYSLRNIETGAEMQDGPTFSALRQIARESRTLIVSGSIPLRHEGKVYNGLVVISR